MPEMTAPETTPREPRWPVHLAHPVKRARALVHSHGQDTAKVIAQGYVTAQAAKDPTAGNLMLAYWRAVHDAMLAPQPAAPPVVVAPPPRPRSRAPRAR